MPDKDTFSEMKRAKEEEYFKKKEMELIEAMKRRAEAERARQELADASGIADDEALQTLHDLGYTRDTVRLLHLVPLVYVAWAEGRVSPAERDLIFEAARLHGVADATPAHQQLSDWLERRPSHDFFEDTLRVIGHLVRSQGDETGGAGLDLLSYCERVAEASGGILGLGKVSAEEDAALARISRAFERSHKSAVDDALKRR
jgi:hypothetical protein